MLVAGIGAYAYWHDHERAKQEAEIRKVINQFADASDTADTEKMVTLMCREEAAQFADGVPDANDDGPIVPGQRQAVEIAYVVIKDDTAMVGVARPPLPTVISTSSAKMAHGSSAIPREILIDGGLTPYR